MAEDTSGIDWLNELLQDVELMQFTSRIRNDLQVSDLPTLPAIKLLKVISYSTNLVLIFYLKMTRRMRFVQNNGH